MSDIFLFPVKMQTRRLKDLEGNWRFSMSLPSEGCGLLGQLFTVLAVTTAQT